MLKWQDGSSGEPGGGNVDESSIKQSGAAAKNQQWPNRECNNRPSSPQRSLSSHDDCEPDINSHQALLVPNRGRSKVCKSTSALCSLLGRWSRSRPEIGGLNSVCNGPGLYPSQLYPSSGALYPSSSGAISSTALASTMLSSTLRKCHTLVSLSSPDRPIQVHPYNRRRPQSNATAVICSRCSSLLSMASSSKYSVNEGKYVPIDEPSSPPTPGILCKLCLAHVPSSQIYTLQCNCVFCLECTRVYVDFEINQGAYEISCPDDMCKSQSIISLREIQNLVNSDTYEKHLRFRKNREVDTDAGLAWCPGVGCETVCTVLKPEGSATCPTCSLRFCSVCRLEPHEDGGSPCPRLSGPLPHLLGPLDSDLIKCCPMCSVPIEKDEGCAQMMCKRCKHVFCWYCLTSLDDDFLLRHYDKGPCKNKLGHSRASVIWHRTQVIGIFAGFGILLLVASPLLLLAAPCIVCCKCRVCTSSDSRVEEDNIPPPTNGDI